MTSQKTKRTKEKKKKRRGTRKKKRRGTRKKKRKRKKEMKPAHIVGFEALVVGMCLALMFYAGTRIAPRGTLSTVAVAFVCGALFHIACEIFGVNAWYARTYFSNEL
jgi:Flp pilus assembly protein TadB